MMAAGCGSRMGAKIPKQFLEIGGKVIPAGWSWDIIGTDDNHYPEKFTHIRFEE